MAISQKCLFFVSIASVFLIGAKAEAGLFKRKSTTIYGIEKKIYASLTEEQKKHIADIYNENEQFKADQKNKEEQLVKKIKELEKELQKVTTLEAEKQRLLAHAEKVQADLNARTKELDHIIELAQHLINESSRGKTFVPSEKREKYIPRINSINRGFNATTLVLDNDTTIEISPFEKEKIELWMRGQGIELSKGDGLIYSIQITNLEVGNTVSAKMKN